MAIQVGGTTVINDSRALQNIASVDATTAASITAAQGGGGGLTLTNFTALDASSNTVQSGISSDAFRITLMFTTNVANSSSRTILQFATSTGSWKTVYTYYGNRGAITCIATKDPRNSNRWYVTSNAGAGSGSEASLWTWSGYMDMGGTLERIRLTDYGTSYGEGSFVVESL